MPENALGFGLRSRARRPSTVPTREALEAVLYDKAYSWELQPGSDVMATCVGVLPKVETYSGYDFYMGLVTVVAGSQGFSDENGGESFWALCPADTPLTWQGQHDASFQTPTAGGVYVAVRCVPEDQPPPYAFPAGWTPGNTTGSGPVLPLVGRAYSQNLYAGLVTLDVALSEASWSARPSGWGLVPADSALGAGLADLSNVDVPAPAGAYVAIYFQSDGDPAPTALPTGWTFHPYGIGPVAITDENAGGLIGDVAYVVSGFVYNPMILDDVTRPISHSNIDSYHVGDLGQDHTNFKIYRCIADLDMGAETGTLVDHPDNFVLAAEAEVEYWPFIERYDLAAKKWLPRIPLPDLGEGNFFATEGGIAGVIDGKLYFGGGDGDVVEGNEFFVYDPADDSITRLDDIPGNPGNVDYAPYGVLNGKLWAFYLFDPSEAYAYDPMTGDWATVAATGPQPGNDQAQGFEIDGKLWFVYDGAAFVFDPVALTVTAKATGGGPFNTSPFLIDGKIHTFGFDNDGNRVAATYHPSTDTWVVRTDIAASPQGTPLAPNDYAAEFVGVTHQDIPYMLSAISPFGASDPVPGVLGLTAVALDKPRVARLQDVIDIALDAAPGMRSERTGGSVLVTPAVGFGAGYLNLNEIEAALDASTVGGAMEWGTSWDGTTILFNDTEHQGLMQVIVSGLIGADDLEGTATLALTQKNGPFFDQASFDLAEGAQGFLLSTTAVFRGADNAFGLFYTAEDTAGSTGIVVPVFISVTIVRIR